MLDLFTTYLKADPSDDDDNGGTMSSQTSSHTPDWLKNPSFFFNHNRKCRAIKSKQKSKGKKSRNISVADGGNNRKFVKYEQLFDKYDQKMAEYLHPKVSLERGHKDIPQSTIEKISPAYRLIKEAFNELQLFTKVCKYFRL